MDWIGRFSESHTIRTDLLSVLLAKPIGRGAARVVFETYLDPKIVVKVENQMQSFQNPIEWERWNMVVGTPAAKWFAPCVRISPCGTVLIQKKAIPAQPHQYPKKVPAFFTDLKRTNFGIIDGKFVCVDYGSLGGEGLYSTKMRKADWWDENSYEL